MRHNTRLLIVFFEELDPTDWVLYQHVLPDEAVDQRPQTGELAVYGGGFDRLVCGRPLVLLKPLMRR